MIVIIVLLCLSLAAAVTVAVWLWVRLQDARRDVADTLAAAAVELGRTPRSGADAVRSIAAGRKDARQRSAFIHSVLEDSPVGVLVLGAASEVVFATGLAARVIDGGHGTASAAAGLRDLGRRVQSTGAAERRRLEVTGPELRSYRAEARPLPPEVGAGVVVRITDVTEQERVEQMRRDFVANVSHELKTPVGALAVLAEALGDVEIAEVRRRLADRLRTEAQRVAALVDDILDLSLVESEPPQLRSVDVGDVVREAVRRVAVVAEDAGMEVVMEMPARSLVVDGDRRQLVSAVANLLDNAVKYSAFRRDPTAKVWVRAMRTRSEIAVEVEDRGIGIAERHRARIFERFYRVDRGRSRAQGGTGLGLAIVRHVALNHGGRVEVESTPGVGSTFRLRLPAEEE